MAGDYLLDTNVVIALLEKDRAVVRRMRSAEAVSIPCIVIGELAYGAFKSARAAENLAKIDELVLASTVLPCELETARCYGEIKAQLNKIGKLIADNDLWIAALAMQHQLTLVTRDQHFDRIDGLDVESW